MSEKIINIEMVDEEINYIESIEKLKDESKNDSTNPSQKYTRKQISCKVDMENKCYEYVYALYKDDKFIRNKTVRVKIRENKTIQYSEEEHLDKVIEMVNNWFKDNNVKIVTLYKAYNLKKYLKEISKYIHKETQIFIKVTTLKDLIQRHILKNKE